MRNIVRAGAVTIAAVAALGTTAAASNASVHRSGFGFPPFYTVQMTNHGDTNTLGNYWAEDSGNNIITLTSLGGGNYTAHMTTEGSFVTNPGQATPNDPAVLVTSNSVAGAKATLAGSADFTFTANRNPLPAGTAIRVTGNLPRSSGFFKLLFPAGTSFTGGMTSYMFTYAQTCPQKWGVQTATQSSTGNTGNISGC